MEADTLVDQQQFLVVAQELRACPKSCAAESPVAQAFCQGVHGTVSHCRHL